MSTIRHKRSEQSGGAVGSGGGSSGYQRQVSGVSEMMRTSSPKAPATKSTIAAAVGAAKAAASSSSPSPVPNSISSCSPSSKTARTLQQPKQQQQTNGQSTKPTGKLVFGLSSRTNKVRHDEYAEKRGAKRDLQQQNLIVAGGGSNLLCGVGRVELTDRKPSDWSIVSVSPTNRPAPENGNGPPPGETRAVVSKQQELQAPREISAGKSSIRASKYGNYYKPQDLVTKPTTTTITIDTNSASRPSRSPTRESTHNYSAANIAAKARSKSPARTGSANQLQHQQQYTRLPDRSQPTTRRSSPTRQKTDIIDLKVSQATNLQPHQLINSPPSSSSMKERGERANSATTMATITKTTTNQDAMIKGTISNNEEQPSATKVAQSLPKMQFNIPPPPQMSNSASNKPGGSVVSYAKSRIYDKPIRQILSNIHPFEGESSLLDSGTIPESILSGFKPPKQVNVSKAREKWEGGEPFAKCKSRQRLAAQANKKLLHGVWSMSSSVVATQQMQLQQVMSNSALAQKNDSPVKILTRGSVLERVQQFEKSPSTSSGSSSGTSSSSSSSGSSSPGSDPGGSSPFLGHHDELHLGPGELMEAVTAASMPTTDSPVNRQASVEAGLALHQPIEPAELRSSSLASGGGGKQAAYKTRVSSIQTQTPQDPLAIIATNGPRSPKSPTGSSSLMRSAGRRPSLGRRRSSSSSIVAIGSNSSSIIPKFYHPNGKPNTYEIELQKKNIVSCFDKFPDRKATITGPTYRRHFHAIALACGFSEYFKEPLYLYVKHQMTKSNLLHNTSTSTVIRQQHRQSGIGPGMINGNSGVALNNIRIMNNDSSGMANGQQINCRPLTRAASIDNSTMEKINNQTFITCEQFLVCWRQMIATAFDNPARFVHLLTLGQRNYLIPDDFVPLIQSIIDDHPGLKFLRSAPDFHMRYIQTVIARIYFCTNKSWTGKISLTELRQSNLLAVLEVLSQEEDINQITDYFSYEHFYVIYCKFWNLDQDHDLLISKEDLAKHNDAAISSRIIERIFMGIVSKQIQATGKMSYSDFVWFLLAEEDKKHPRSIEYWFRLLDIDGDGYISMYEMEYFYYEQMKRLELMNIEALPFIDSACQILDLVNPKEKNKISLADLKRTKMATIFFDTFINLEKYLEHESREFVSTRDCVQDGVVISDWDRYASEEYESLVTEESSV